MYCASAFAFDFAGYLYMQRVMNAAARLVSGTRKFDRGLSQLLHVDLHWLDVADRAQFKLAMTVHRCLNNKAPHYLADSCIPVSWVVPRHHRTTLGRRAFAVAGPSVWNLLLDNIRNAGYAEATFKQMLKTFFLTQH